VRSHVPGAACRTGLRAGRTCEPPPARRPFAVIVERIENCTNSGPRDRSTDLHSNTPDSGAPLSDGHNWKEWVSVSATASTDAGHMLIEGSLAFGCRGDADFNARHHSSPVGANRRSEGTGPGTESRPAVIAANVRRKQPMHPPSQFAITIGPQHEMEVARHDTPSQSPRRQACAPLFHELHECLMVVSL
jgi:hypothetical protein